MVYSAQRTSSWCRCLVLLSFLVTTCGCQIGGARSASELVRSLPAYPNARFLSEFQTALPDDVPSSGVTYESDDQSDQVSEFYVSALPAEGWDLVSSVEQPPPGVPWQLRFERKGWWCQVVIEENAATQIRVRVGKQ